MWYRAGTVAVISGSAVVTGAGVAWAEPGVVPGHTFYGPDGALYEVLTVTLTQISLTQPYAGQDATGQPYAVVPAASLNAELHAAVTEMIGLARTVIDEAAGSATAAAETVAQITIDKDAVSADRLAVAADKTAAANSAAAAGTDAAQVNTDKGIVAADLVTAAGHKTAAATSATAASTAAAQVNTDKGIVAADLVTAAGHKTAAATSATAAGTDAAQVNTDKGIVAADKLTAAGHETAAATSATAAAADAAQVNTDKGIVAADLVSVVNARLATEAARDAALTAYDNFDDRYLGGKSADPVLDNDGNALAAGTLYFNETSEKMRLWTGALWVEAYVSGEGVLQAAQNLSDLTDKSVARTNLGVQIGLHVQAFSAALNGTTASFTTALLNKINSITAIFTTALLTKLNGIEPNATADQTNSEIKTAYLANADTNNLTDTLLNKINSITAIFTTALANKLNDIEASADKTDATNVAAAGALMDGDAATAAHYRAKTAGKVLTPAAVWDAAAFVALADGSSIAVDMSAGLNFEVTIAGNRTLSNPANVKPGQGGSIRVQQDATGSRTLSFGSYYKFAGGEAPTLTTAANAADVLYFHARSATEIFVTASQDMK
jgi:hypothetical protein